MCGGSGTRLWPASRPSRPKQFIPLTGEVSSFQATVQRVAGIAGVATPVVIAGVRHREILAAQLAEIGETATLLLEPAARDSAAAMAAAAAWIAEQDADGVAVFVSADHDVPDTAAFQRAVEQAVEAARGGRIVTLGVQPTFPATAFGYIRPGDGAGVRTVEAFVEKPDEARARQYVDEGYLWNSGNFVTAARALLDELSAHAPQVAETAIAAVRNACPADGAIVLGDIFREAPRVSIDYAVMEKTARASVLPVSFAWADIGAWDAVHTVSSKDDSRNSAPAHALLLDAQGCLVRSPGAAQVAVVGGRNLAIIVEDGAVLVCDLSSSQGVKTAGEHFRGPPQRRFTSVAQARAWFGEWLYLQALPLWWTLGADHEHGGFRETLGADGEPVERWRRARVPARQAYAYAASGLAGWKGPWRQAVRHGLDALRGGHRRNDGLYAAASALDGAPVDREAYLYDQAFMLLALATAQTAKVHMHEAEALALLDRIEAAFRIDVGFREAGPKAYQSNAMMHLFEASLAWRVAGVSPHWSALCDELAGFALRHLFDADLGVVREFFTPDWNPAEGPDGERVEPGHQFEWAWLLDRHGGAASKDAARRLYASGLRGLEPARGVVVNAVDTSFEVVDAGARLWPQTEYLRAAATFGDEAAVLSAASAVARYLDNPGPGLWRDELRSDGEFTPGPSPASSLYHIVGGVQALLDRTL
jgi:mannose-1-phosphate guanylyltransferase/mannose-6-phosphate isomerase